MPQSTRQRLLTDRDQQGGRRENWAARGWKPADLDVEEIYSDGTSGNFRRANTPSSTWTSPPTTGSPCVFGRSGETTFPSSNPASKLGTPPSTRPWSGSSAWPPRRRSHAADRPHRRGQDGPGPADFRAETKPPPDVRPVRGGQRRHFAGRHGHVHAVRARESCVHRDGESAGGLVAGGGRRRAVSGRGGGVGRKRERSMPLMAIQEKRFLPAGSGKEATGDFQLICGTNKDLSREAAAGRFRPDLLARINLWDFAMPGLRDRPEDIAPNLDLELEKFPRGAGRRGPTTVSGFRGLGRSGLGRQFPRFHQRSGNSNGDPGPGRPRHRRGGGRRDRTAAEVMERGNSANHTIPKARKILRVLGVNRSGSSAMSPWLSIS